MYAVLLAVLVLFAAFCCSGCHDALDSRSTVIGHTKIEIEVMHFEGMVRTQQIWMNEGLVNLA